MVQWLDPQPADAILDLGCGDGILTAKIKALCASVVGIDASPNLVKAAEKAYGSETGLSWHVQDCRHLDQWSGYQEAAYSKVFSNAALHWILRDASYRLPVFRAVFKILRPGGRFVFEMGGAGNVAEVHTALMAAIVHRGASLDRAMEVSPWFFPSKEFMKTMLEDTGFWVEKCELEYRPTKLTAEEKGGIEGWVRLMGAQFLEVLAEEKREAAVQEICELLKPIITHEDGSSWLGYVRLRVLAHKPEG